MKFEGLHTAIVTPFDSFGMLDQDGLRRNLRFQLKHEVDGIVVLGTTGETPTLSNEEKELVIRIAAEEVKGKAILTVGTGSYSTQQTILDTRLAYDLGADAALIITPYYNRPTQEGLYRHFAAVCEAVSLPICIYNNPIRTGINMHVATLARLATLPSIIGVKEGNGNIAHINEIFNKIVSIKADFRVLACDDEITLPLMSLGGHGVISVISNLVPSAMRSLVKAAQKENFTLARHWHQQLLELFSVIFIESNPIPIKAAMQLKGMAAGLCRLPLCELSQQNLSALTRVVNKLPPAWLGEYGQA